MRRKHVLVAACGVLVLVLLLTWRDLACLFWGIGDGLAGAVGDASDSYLAVRNVLELLNFVSGPALAALALIGGLVAFRQFKEAEHSRYADIYMKIVARWNSAELVQSRLKLFAILRSYQANEAILRPQYPSKGAFLASVLLYLRETDLEEHRNHMAVLNFFEDIGNLCWKGYVREVDIFDFMSAQIVNRIDELAAYMVRIREESSKDVEKKSTYAGAIYLHRRAKEFRGSPGHVRKIHVEEFNP